MSSTTIQYLLNLLSRRDYTEFELRRKMQDKGFSDEEINQGIAYCQEKKWQSDKRFCENYIHVRSQRGHGLLRIKQELLHTRGVEQDIIDECLLASEVDWEQVALLTLQKKFPRYASIHDLKTKHKIWRYMQSKGFSSSDFAHHLKDGYDCFD